MLKRVICSSIFALMLFNQLTFAADFLSSAQIENIGNKKYKAIRLTPQIYNNSKENLADIMMYNKDNQPIPYFINSYSESNSETKTTYPMKLINSFVKADNEENLKYKHYFFDYTLANLQENDVVATSIEVKTNITGFAKKVELLGSYDGNAWEAVQNDMLYDVDGNKKLEIVFSGVKKYTHYRFKVLNNLEKISFSSVNLNYNNIVKNKDSFTSTFYPQYAVETKDKTTVVKISGLKNLKVDSISIETDSMFKRNVSFESGASKFLYNLSFKDTAYKDTILPLNGYKVKSDSAELIIHNGDDKPINVNKLEIKYLLDELVFDGPNGGAFTLKFGNTDVISPPSYDIVNYKEKIVSEGYDILEVKEIKTIPPKPSEPKYDYRWIFNIVVTIVAIIMGVVIIFKLKKKD